MSKRTNLKPCPFCGAKDEPAAGEDNALAFLLRRDFGRDQAVWCTVCDARGPYGQSRPMARKLWNTRQR